VIWSTSLPARDAAMTAWPLSTEELLSIVVAAIVVKQ
jgi:hypothetical protein